MKSSKIRKTDMPKDADLLILKRRFEDHLDEYKDHIDMDRLQHLEYLQKHEKTMEAINTLTAATQGIVDAWTFANSFHRLVKWLSGFGILAVVFTWFSTRFGGHF